MIIIFLVLDNTILLFPPTASFGELQLFFSPVGGTGRDLTLKSVAAVRIFIILKQKRFTSSCTYLQCILPFKDFSLRRFPSQCDLYLQLWKPILPLLFIPPPPFIFLINIRMPVNSSWWRLEQINRKIQLRNPESQLYHICQNTRQLGKSVRNWAAWFIFFFFF